MKDRWPAFPQEPEAPIRGELLGIERLEHVAEDLATAHRISARPGSDRRLARRLRDNARVLRQAYHALVAAIEERQPITPAAQWLVDNFHQVEEQVHEIVEDLPPGFYRQLPKLADGEFAGQARVFGLAWAFVAHTDSRFDPQELRRFVQAYQHGALLTIGELWAVAITLRVVLVENLRRVAERIVTGRAARRSADVLADRILGVGAGKPDPATEILKQLERRPLPAAFAVQLVARLRDRDPQMTPALHWLGERLAAQGTTADEVVETEHHLQGAMNVTVRNVITSMRLISSIDWPDFVESVSLVDAELHADNAFAENDFPTRDRYRREIEELARGSNYSEAEVARRAVMAADRGISRQRDPGYHLLAGGRRALEAELDFKPSWRGRRIRLAEAAGVPGYLGSIALMSACLLALPLGYLAVAGIRGWALAGLAIAALFPALDAAVALVNRIVSRGIGPKSLPGLALRDGVPASLSTLIVVPTLLTSEADLAELIERLEVHHMASPDGYLRFGLLSDWTDSDTETAPGDDELLAAAAAGIAHLNSRHEGLPDGPRFLLFHRKRVWNQGEKRWIGWERKRGKLHELNRLLRGAADTTFLCPPAVPAGIRYVITLDSDTRLPRGAARRLIGKMAHPLNQPLFDARSGRVIEGYAVLQPRVTPSLPGDGEGSLFGRIFSSAGGMDPYAFAVSDVYQDLFGEGSYSGKGVYDVDAFEAALAGRIPESTLLSHDLLEGTFARAGLVSDIEVVEEFPARYNVDAARHHRWARGDWQLIPWLFGHAPVRSGDRVRDSLPAVGRWKMADNLRRTLSAPATVLAFVGGWTLPAAAAAGWSGFLAGLVAIPALLPGLSGLLPRRSGISTRSHLRAVRRDGSLALSRIAFQLTVLSHQAWLMADAIGRTLVRLFVTRRRLLEWVTAAQAGGSPRLGPLGFYRKMKGGVAIAVAGGTVAVFAGGQGTWLVAAPLIALWLLAPLVALWTSSPLGATDRKPLSAEGARALRLVARRTWRFFDTFVTPRENMLPPDNFQEDPRPVVANRTSPTNIGLYLLSVVSARDFGWLGVFEATERLESTLGTMKRLERFRGHFYNWYDTHDLRPLDPKYISSVDSGNLAGHLIALANACEEAIEQPVSGPAARSGIGDALALARQALCEIPDDRRAQIVTRAHAEEAIDAFERALAFEPTPTGIAAGLSELGAIAVTIWDIARTLSAEKEGEATAAALAAVQALHASVESHQRDVERLMPWALLLARDPGQGTLGSGFDAIPRLCDLPERCDEAIRLLESNEAADPDALTSTLARAAEGARSLVGRLRSLAALSRRFAADMEFGFLLDPERRLLSIGYAVESGQIDPSCYDLLASEARLASFVAIAKGDVPTRHWFRLGRAVTPVDRGSVLLSWSGSMFEYLMPSLVMSEPPGSHLEQTSRLVVRRQRQYGASLGVPWGISESAYNARDLEMTYQYSNFGLPDLGLKRGLAENLVVAPYATGLAAMIDPEMAARNYAVLAAAGGRGQFGWYEALDYTPSRVPEGRNVAIVRAYMAHHQGMTVVAIANALLGGAMRSRFHSEPSIRATELLLQERTPRDVAIAHSRVEEVKETPNILDLSPRLSRLHGDPHGPVPRTHLLSNGTYTVMITAAGSGFSRYRDMDVTRWREDATCDPWGSYVFLRDARSGALWSAGYQPCGVEPDHYAARFLEDRAEFARRDGSIATRLEVAVSPENDAEVRRVSVTNLGGRVREIDITSYAEVALASRAADAAHPAFSKLFVQTEFAAEVGTLLATRRRRSATESEIWAAHLAVVEGDVIGGVQFETDRARFLGRGRTIGQAVAVGDGRPLSNTAGTVLDPVFSLRYRVRLAPGATAHVAFWTLVAPSRQEALDLADKHLNASAFERTLTLAWTQAQVQLQHLGLSLDEAHLYQQLANHVLYSDPRLRPSSDVLARNDLGQRDLWPHGISGDLPIVLCRIDTLEDLDIIRQLLRAHSYWHLKRLAVDLVILNEKAPSYDQDLQSALEALVRATPAPAPGDGAIFILRSDLLAAEARTLLRSVGRAVILARRGSLFEQLDHLPTPRTAIALPIPRRAPESIPPKAAPARPDLEFFNGLGGFADGGREYVTILGPGQWTPAPWINVIANPTFGFHVSVEGSGFTWAENSRENALTPWSNDPVGDRPGEAVYVRDEDTGEVWGPTALPIRLEDGTYVCRHGQGQSRFEHVSHDIALDLLQFVPPEDPIKISRLKLRNLSGRPRRLTVTVYVEWVLGAGATWAIATERDPATGALLARNPWSGAFGRQVAFMDLGGAQRSWTGDRTEFLGRNGRLDRPAALAAPTALSGRVGVGLDPCGVLQATVDLEPGGSREMVFLLGEAASGSEATAMVTRYRAADLDDVLQAVTRHWDDLLGTVQVRTPDRSLDILLNRWLVYQTLACRVWARAGFYQASGAYGFRDQLQDGMALCVAAPGLTREHLLRAAARQFVEGDVQHWWLPHSGQGVRTRMSDDRAWLPYAIAHYISVTGDRGVLDEAVPYLSGPPLRPDEHEAFFLPELAEERATLFEHCARALDLCLEVGDRGLPLIGTGDWNDGMNRVGEGGRGESTWLGWFLCATLPAMAELAAERGERKRATAWRRHASFLGKALHKEAWDGDWYRRGYFDDGTPLGSATGTECQIDAIAQSWAVLSGAADTARSVHAMAALENRLVRREDGLVLLFDPPFDQTPLDPGYIKGYPPGIRENGGQYTHAAVWSLIAFAQLGDGNKAAELFSILDPIRRSSTRAAIQRYKVEPYAVAADVYSQPPHVGRGGWTWYTGSAAWLYRAGLEWILGFRVQGGTLVLDPCIPKAWPGFEIAYRYGNSRYEIKVENPRGVSRGVAKIEIDGEAGTGDRIALVDDGAVHRVRVVLG